MFHTFLLLVYLGSADTKKLTSGDMYFADINQCLYFASRVSTVHGNFKYKDYVEPKDRIIAYCVPRALPDDTKVKVY
jgi:hypothetical protein